MGLSAVYTACGGKDFSAVQAIGIVAAQPYRLDAEQAMLTEAQLECGVRSGLWNPPVQVADYMAYRLTDSGRALKFDDDPVEGRPGYRSPYVQVRGDFPLHLAAGPKIRDDGPDTRIVSGTLSVAIKHACFPDPLPLMGVSSGHFSQDVSPVLRFEKDADVWHFVKLEH